MTFILMLIKSLSILYFLFSRSQHQEGQTLWELVYIRWLLLMVEPYGFIQKRGINLSAWVNRHIDFSSLIRKPREVLVPRLGVSAMNFIDLKAQYDSIRSCE